MPARRGRLNGKKRGAPSSSEDGSAISELEDTDNGASDSYRGSDDVQSLHSDALDEDSDRGTKVRVEKRKGSSRKRLRKNAASDEDEGGEDPGLKEGQELVGKVIQAPKTGRGEYFVYVRRLEPTYHRSSPGSDISKHV
jgi:hypothetical protein